MNQKKVITFSLILFIFCPIANTAIAQNIYTVGDGGQFGYFDLQTRNYTSVSLNLGSIHAGLACQAGIFYSISPFISGAPLHTITTTGIITTIGDTNNSTSGIASNGATLYDHNFSGNAIGTLNTATGAFTSVGATGISSADVGGRIAFNSGALYGTMRTFGGSGNGLYLFNSSTGLASFIGNGGAASSYSDMAATFSSNGTLYGIQNVSGTQTLYSINTTSGNLTLQGSITGAGMPTTFYGAAQELVPEPSSLLFIWAGISAFLFRRRSSKL